MTADTPEALHARVAAALNAGDLDAFAGDLALLHGRWRLTLAGEALSGTGTLVARRDLERRWRIVLDDPLAPR